MSVSQEKAANLSALRLFPVLVLLAVSVTLLGCSESASESDTEIESPETYVPEPNYVQQEKDLFMYVGALTEEEQASGMSKPVILYRYHGREDGVYRLERVADDGSSLHFVECIYPCRVAKTTNFAGTVTRDAVERGSIIYSAFQDAANGLLVATSKPSSSTAIREAGEPPLVPAASASTPDWRGQRGRCFLLVGGKLFISGDCWIRMEGQGSFQIMSPDEQYFAQLSRSGKSGFGYWNETPGSTHAQSPLGQMERSGGCWKNDSAEICAWESQ